MKKSKGLDFFIDSSPEELNSSNSKKTSEIQKTTKRRGPPNRMNDLDYKTWMKFQKSFFFAENHQEMIEKAIFFFTKAKWDDGSSSTTLIGGFPGFDPRAIPDPRVITIIEEIKEFLALETRIVENSETYDFLFLNLLPLIPSPEGIVNFLQETIPNLFKETTRLLKPDRYCCFLISPIEGINTGFPLPWVVSEIGRKYLRLRDEKIIIFPDGNKIHYLVHFQKIQDERSPSYVFPNDFQMRTVPFEIPAWIIPTKIPARTNMELRHPGKFPEPLIDEFILRFTKEKDTVFDPMVGIGSTIVSALNNRRNGYGVELNPEFVEMTKRRIRILFPTPLSHFLEDEKQVGRPKHQVIQGNALELDKISELKNFSANYCVTSPPYWTMLKRKGSEYQKFRREAQLKLTYSDSEQDLGNIADYNEFINLLVKIYEDIGKRMLVDEGFLTVITKYVKRDHFIYPLPWDLVFKLCRKAGVYEYVGTTFWCQDDLSIRPFALGIYWVSNTLHHYCLHFRKRGKL